MAVRAYVSGDFEAVCRIYADAKRAELQFEDGSFDITPLDQDAGIMAAFEESDILVCETSEVVGFAAVHESTLRALFVHSEARRMGVGAALLGNVLGSTPHPVLNVAKSNRGARRFYEQHGFVVAGTSMRQYGGRDIEYVTMRRPLQLDMHAGQDTGDRSPMSPGSQTGHGLPGVRQ